MKGFTPKFLPNLVKHFKLAKFGYSINVNPNKPVLKISSQTDKDALNTAKDAKKQRCVENVKKGVAAQKDHMQTTRASSPVSTWRGLRSWGLELMY